MRIALPCLAWLALALPGVGAAHPQAQVASQAPSAPRSSGGLAELAELGLALADAPAGDARDGLAADYAAAALALARGLESEAKRTLLTAAAARLAPFDAELAAPAAPTGSRARLAVELASHWLERGRLDGSTDAIARAERDFAKVVAAATDGDPLALRAELGLGECARARGDHAAAAQHFASVADRAVPADDALWREASATLSRDERARRFALLELATPGWLESLAAAGRHADACAAGLRWWRTWRRDDFPLSTPNGELAALTLVRLLASPEAAAGTIGWSVDARDAAFFTDQAAARAAGGSTCSSPREFAVLLLRAALDARGDRLGPTALARATELVLVDSANHGERALLGADEELVRRLARAAFAARAFRDAAALYESTGRNESASADGAAGAIDGARDDLAAERLWHLGRCAEELGDSAKAAAEFRAVVERHPQAKPWSERAAEAWYRLVSAPQRDGSRVERRELEDATRAARELGVGAIAADAAFRDGERLLREKRPADARAAFAAVPPEAAPYELAWVYRAIAEYQLGRLDEADRALTEFVEVRVRDPRFAPSDSERSERRRTAVAFAELYHGLVAFDRAARTNSTGDWQLARARLEPYLARHANRAELAPLAAARALSACLRLGDFAAAETLEGELFTAFPDHPASAAAALEMYRERERRRAALRANESEESTRLLRAMARELELANRNADEPSFANLRAESRAWLELGESARARIVLDRIVRVFGERERETVEKWVLSDLALALARDGEPRKAAELLAPPCAAGRATPAVELLYARVLGGWYEFAEGKGTEEFPGVEDAASFALAAELYARQLAREPKFESRAYQLRAAALYARWRHGRTEPTERDAARAELAALRAELGERFERLADAPLAAELRWLAERVR